VNFLQRGASLKAGGVGLSRLLGFVSIIPQWDLFLMGRGVPFNTTWRRLDIL